jgi:hypothetical protein
MEKNMCDLYTLNDAATIHNLLGGSVLAYKVYTFGIHPQNSELFERINHLDG